MRFLAITFDSFESAYSKEIRFRELYEKFNLGWDALDIVACVGLERLMRGAFEGLAKTVEPSEVLDGEVDFGTMSEVWETSERSAISEGRLCGYLSWGRSSNDV